MNVLAISPHADDVELGAGGTIARLAEEGHRIHIIALSLGHEIHGATLEELTAAAKTLLSGRELGVYQQDKLFPCRDFNLHRQEVLDVLIKRRDETLPDLVFVPSTANVHQDHQVVTAEAIRAFRSCSLLGYEMPWGDVRGFTPQLYYRIAHRHRLARIEALRCYQSQRSRPYFGTDALDLTLKLRGLQIETSYAEAFEVIRWVV